ncbi:type II toxin-antitoxin system VapC family toxin [Arsenicicoccus bolidensis]|uniref:PIN domain-containing protein n=1 Tax=Arsenicicoccus bolidensis TaxID=229480 RepID=A0ABS9Q145_9MICO|nr:PIN domain-containing protein [Arsenicicoccus bolidensis]MCG7321576.1 PIN domain-containing protein [Arsenicicoccus bolidensis]
MTLDTSFVVSLLNSGEPHHGGSRRFADLLVASQSLVVYNRLLEIELVEVAFKLAVKERHGTKAWPAKRGDGRVRPRAGRLARELLRSWGDFLEAVPYLCVELHEVSDDVPEAMIRWGLGSYDAVHVVSALYAGNQRIVTVDAGFGAVPEQHLTIYTDASRLRSTRRRRGGA